MIRIPSIPDGAPVWDGFSCTLNGKPAAIHEARVSAIPYNRSWPGQQRPLNQTELAGFLSVEADEPVEVELVAARDFENVVIRPLSKGVTAQTDGRTIRFTVSRPGSYSVELDGPHNNLTLFVNPVRDFGISPDDENVLYFGPGVHRPGSIELTSGQTVYIDAEAVVYGTISAFNAHDIRILGYGILDGSEVERIPSCYPYYTHANEHPSPDHRPFEAPNVLSLEEIRYQIDRYTSRGTLQFWRGEHIEIEGIVLRDSSTFTARLANLSGLLIDNVKAIGMWRYNADGLDLINSQNAIIRNCYLRNFDDCMVIKGVCSYQYQPNENILVQNCTIWCDWGSALEIGAETYAPAYRNILFEDCDLIRGAHAYMRIQHHNQAEIHHISYRNIRCEFSNFHYSPVYHAVDDAPYEKPNPTVYPHLIHLWVCNRGWFAEPALFSCGKMHDISFENIQILTDPELPLPTVQMTGVSPVFNISNVSLNGLFRNGERITDFSFFTIDDFVENVKLK